VSDLAEHLTERQRRPKDPTSDGDVLRQTVLHQQPTALENLWKTALGLVMRFGFCDSQVHFSERELTFTFAIGRRPSVVCRLSLTFVHPTQAIKIFGNVSMLFGTFAISNLSVKILRRSSQGNPSVGGLNARGDAK